MVIGMMMTIIIIDVVFVIPTMIILIFDYMLCITNYMRHVGLQLLGS